MSDNIDGSGLAFLAAAALFWTIFAIGFYSTSPRALRSADRVAPLIAGPRRLEVADVA